VVSFWRCILVVIPVLMSAAEVEPAPAPPTAGAQTAPAPAGQVAPAPVRPAENAGQEQPETTTWPSKRLRAASRAADLLGTAIFELIEDLDLYKIPLGEGTIGFNVGRRVYDNYDVLGSFTVVDRFRVKLGYPLSSWSDPVNGTLTARFGVGTDQRLECVHIRQVRPTDFTHLDAGATLPEDLFAPGWNQTTDTHRSVAADGGWNRLLPAASTSAEVTSGDAFDGLGRARWGKLWNLLIVPFRVPSKPDWIERVAPGDIVSWKATGSVEVGPGVDVSLAVPGALKFYDAGLSFRIFVKGEFNVAVLREDLDHVRVRISHKGTFGDRIAFGGKTDGIISSLDFGSNPLDRLSRFSPLSASRRRQLGRGFDLVYRYDLRDPEARQAYRNAVFGNLTASDRLAGGKRWMEQADTAAVQRIGEQHTTSRGFSLDTSTRLGSFYRHSHETEVEHSDIEINVGQGRQKVFRSRARNLMQWRWFWGAKERNETEVTVWADRDRLEAGAQDALTLTVQHEILDTVTTGTELLQDIDLVESATGRVGFFPRPPPYQPQNSVAEPYGQGEFDRRRQYDVAVLHPTRLGRSSFFAQVTYSQDQIQRFLDVPQRERWRDLETVFGVAPGTWSTATRRGLFYVEHSLESLLNLPLYPINQHLRRGSILATAQSASRSWRRADRTDDLYRRVSLLVELFASRRHGYELTQLLRLRLGKEPVSYVLRGSNFAFGTLRAEGQGTAPLDPLPEQITDIIEFDAIRARRNSAPTAIINKLETEPVDHDRLKVRLELAEGIKASAVYVRLIEQRPWSQSQSIGAAVVARLEHPLHGGVNEWIIDRRSGPLSDILRRTEPGLEYELAVAISVDGRTWGRVDSASFVMPAPPAGAQDVLRPLLMEE